MMTSCKVTLLDSESVLKPQDIYSAFNAPFFVPYSCSIVFRTEATPLVIVWLSLGLAWLTKTYFPLQAMLFKYGSTNGPTGFERPRILGREYHCLS